MKAARWHAARDIRIEMVPDPAPSAHDVLLRVDWCGICGTEKELIGSLSQVHDEDFAAAVDMPASGRVQVAGFITHRLSLEDVVTQGFEKLAAGDQTAIKILVAPR
jgi:threonine dehydrogenase-like Zn-dependent dehydrogenase